MKKNKWKVFGAVVSSAILLSVAVVCAILVSVALVSCTPENTPDSDTTVTPIYSLDENDFVENQTWNSTVSIIWDGASATVNGAVEGVSVEEENGYVVVTSTAKHVEYSLSGSGTGQFKVYSDYKFRLNLEDLVLTCSNGPAINNQCTKTCYTVVSGMNVLKDGSTYADSDESQKAAFFSEGQLVFSGTGSLTVTGAYKHALASDDYICVREGEMNLTASVSDGMHANDGIFIAGGTITINAAGDGIQCDTSTIVITDGVVNIVSAGDKGILAYGNIYVYGGTVTVNSTGKGIKTKSDLEVQGGTITVIAGGTSSSRYAPPGGGGGRPGESSGVEGIEAKGKIKFPGGFVYAQASDDAINSGGDMVVRGGYVCAYSTGNDGLDANGNCYIESGLVYAIGAGSPEVAVDANSEEQKKLYVIGGTLIAIGGLESGASLTQSCYSASSWSPSTWYYLRDTPMTSYAFLTPASTGTPLVVSPMTSVIELKSDVTVSGGTSIFNGMVLLGPNVSGGTDVTLSSYTGGSSGPGGGPGGGPGW